MRLNCPVLGPLIVERRWFPVRNPTGHTGELLTGSAALASPTNTFPAGDELPSCWRSPAIPALPSPELAVSSGVPQPRSADWQPCPERALPSRGSGQGRAGDLTGIFFSLPMCSWLLEDSGKGWPLITSFYKRSRACARLRFGLSQPWRNFS